jgi:predicted permease
MITVFTKLASQLSLQKLPELAVIPLLFTIMTVVSLLSSGLMTKIFGFNQRQKNFVTAMAVFGNSNSLPMSLVVSLSKTIDSLRWPKIPHDNAREVEARGLLYLVIFQQLGQAVRWSWGLNVLLRPADKYTVDEGGVPNASEEEQQPLIGDRSPSSESLGSVSNGSQTPNGNGNARANGRYVPDWPESGAATPLNRAQYTSSSSTLDELSHEQRQGLKNGPNPNGSGLTHYNGVEGAEDPDDIMIFRVPEQRKGTLANMKAFISSKLSACKTGIASRSHKAFIRLPKGTQTFLDVSYRRTSHFLSSVRSFMNPPLYAMIIAIVVASVPKLQVIFFHEHTFVYNSITRAVDSCGKCAVPLILVCLGGNLARNTLPREARDAEDPKLEKKLLTASLLARMVLPFIILTPILALFAKYVPVSILDDPIFLVVAFLLAGAPSALQLSQICQMNNVYMGVMSKLLVHSYVIWYVPFDMVFNTSFTMY